MLNSNIIYYLQGLVETFLYHIQKFKVGFTDPDHLSMATGLNGIGVLVQYKHLHTILYRPILSASVKYHK